MVFAWLFVVAAVSTAGGAAPGTSAPPAKQDSAEHQLYKAEVVRVLNRFYPDDRRLIAKTEIRIIDGDPLDTRLCGERCIQISTGTIRYFRNKYEYYAILVHEFGHVRGGHTSTLVSADFLTQVIDFDLMERQELAADQAALKVLRRRNISVCFLRFALDRFMLEFPPEDNPNDPYRKIIDKRLAVVHQACPVR